MCLRLKSAIAADAFACPTAALAALSAAFAEASAVSAVSRSVAVTPLSSAEVSRL